VSYHGLALNINTELSYFQRFSPCGYAGSVMTSMQEQLGAVVSMDSIAKVLADNLCRIFSEARKSHEVVV
jgi:lipoate-protein ligase B